MTGFVFALAWTLLVPDASRGEGGASNLRIPGEVWSIHDPERPAPVKVVPGSSGLPPSDATLLFGSDRLDLWKDAAGGPARWKIAKGVVTASPGSRRIETRQAFGDSQIHLEWRIPAARRLRGQKGSNSGLLLMGRYEIQILNSHTNVTYPGRAGGRDLRAVAAPGQRQPSTR